MKFIFLSFLFGVSFASFGAEVYVAVASNFSEAMKELVKSFESTNEHKVKISIGSTGKHYAQIKNGAPFDIFFSADEETPEKIEKEGIGVKGSRFVYGRGKIVLWTKARVSKKNNVTSYIKNTRYLALANPKLAPYGKAARDYLSQMKLWGDLAGKVVLGENVNQAFQYVSSGNAAFGIIAYSQVKRLKEANRGTFWMIDPKKYRPIRQGAFLLKESRAARDFILFIKSERSLRIIENFGYGG